MHSIADYSLEVLMGRFLNPDNGAFSEAVNSEIYIDKTRLMEYTNQVINTTSKFICNSRPRRFGKSMTADMLSAYYSRGCVSKELFKNYEISTVSSYEKNLNKYDVIHFDVQWCMMDAKDADHVVDYINEGILQELREAYGQIIPDAVRTAYGAMSYIKAATGNKFVVIIDEWDVLIRDEAQNHTLQEAYIDFLRGMFKGTEPSRYIALAYLTGILPIKKLKTQSALNNFEEFTMLDAGRIFLMTKADCTGVNTTQPMLPWRMHFRPSGWWKKSSSPIKKPNFNGRDQRTTYLLKGKR